MDIIKLAREFGHALQKDSAYINLQEVKKKNDSDENLQNLINELNLKKLAISNEFSSENRNEDKIQELNSQMREVYSKIMQNENMIAYNEAKNEFNEILRKINAIIMGAAAGEDPETADIVESGCSGSCSSCSGCH